MMGGSIWLESKKGEGSTFYFEVAFKRGNRSRKHGKENVETDVQSVSHGTACEEEGKNYNVLGIDILRTKTVGRKEADKRKKDEKNQDVSRINGEHIKILLAEDNPVNQEYSKVLLERRGYEVVAVENGREVLKKLEEQRIDLILLDIQMPEMDGFQTATAIREVEKKTGRHIPIVAVTSHAMKDDRQKCIDAGMDDYISKPMEANKLYSIIGKFLKENMVEEKWLTPPASLKRIEHSLEGNRDILEGLLSQFIKVIPEYMMQLEGWIKSRNADETEKMAHKIRGTLSNFDAETASSLAFQIESMARQTKMEAVEEVFAQLEEEVGRVKEYLSDVLRKSS